MQLTFLRNISFLTLIIILVNSSKLSATHIYGGELLYNHVNGNMYRITLTLYGDCSGTSFNGLKLARPTIKIYDGSIIVDSLFLLEDTLLRKEVSPVCKEDFDSTSCKKITSTLPGVTRFVYNTTKLLAPSANWRIVFDGPMNNNTLAGRSNNITNVAIGGSGQLIYLEAKLNNINGPNSSPEYSSIPTPYYCINRAQQYNQGAIDADGDSLSFSIVPALTGGFATQYIPPYTGVQPLAAAQGSFSFNTTSGQLNFLPDMVQRSLVVTRVDEYKNGVLVGSSLREMTFIVLDNCNNNPPTGLVDTNTIVGGGVIDNVINVCANTPELELSIPASDSDGNNITVELNNIPQGAIATVSDNGTRSPVIKLKWVTGKVQLGTYNLFATYTDDACPLFSSQTVAYTIKIVNAIGISHEVIQPTNCVYRQHVAIKLMDGLIPRFITITNSNNEIIKSYTDSTGIIIDSFKRGTYTVNAESIALKCRSQHSFTVNDSGTFPIPLIYDDLNICLNDKEEQLRIEPVQGASINWYNNELMRLVDAPIYKTNVPGKQQWLVSQQVSVCETIIDTITVTVHDFPEIAISNQPMRICAGDSVQLKATGGVRYEWQPEEQVVTVTDTLHYTSVRQPTTYIVTGYSEYNCANTDTVVYNDIEQCCRFTYPSAFTPNADGINDGWHPITYGNTDQYLLYIYNRWGQRVFISSNQDEKWDGTYNGKPCEMDTYTYFIRALCVTGSRETGKGSFILIR